jgi:chlorobactene glucosyltransferase
MILEPYWQSHPFTVVGFLLVLLLIVLLNYFTIPRLGDCARAQDSPLVSILVPARNEERNIRACVESLLSQDFPAFEILVLDDHSTDGTRLILEEISRRESRLQVIEGQALPDGWLGKHWANHQLSRRASGQLLLFTDADTRHRPNTLRDSVSSLLAWGADLITAFPRQEMVTWGERLTVPILSFSVLCFFPVLLARSLRVPALSVTIGQFMLFRRQAFEAIGGYEAVRGEVVDDVVLGRNIVRHGLDWQLLDGTRHISCRMYTDFATAWEGFTKNLFALFDYRILLYVIGWAWICVSFLLPLVVLLFPAARQSLTFPIPMAGIAVFEALVTFALAYHRFRFPAYLVLLYPLHILVFTLLAMHSLFVTLSRRGSWKGRSLPSPTLRL